MLIGWPDESAPKRNNGIRGSIPIEEEI